MSTPQEQYRAQVELYRAQVEKYAALLRSPTEDYSRVLPHVLPHVPPDALAAVGAPLLEARVRMAEARLRLDLRSELMQSGVVVSEEQLNAMIDAIPREDYFRLIAART